MSRFTIRTILSSKQFHLPAGHVPQVIGHNAFKFALPHKPELQLIIVVSAQDAGKWSLYMYSIYSCKNNFIETRNRIFFFKVLLLLFFVRFKVNWIWKLLWKDRHWTYLLNDPILRQDGVYLIYFIWFKKYILILLLTCYVSPRLLSLYNMYK